MTQWAARNRDRWRVDGFKEKRLPARSKVILWRPFYIPPDQLIWRCHCGQQWTLNGFPGLHLRPVSTPRSRNMEAPANSRQPTARQPEFGGESLYGDRPHSFVQLI